MIWQYSYPTLKKNGNGMPVCQRTGCYGSAYPAPSVKTMCCPVLMAFQSTVGTKKVVIYRIYWMETDPSDHW